MIVISLPLRLVSEANVREHHMVKARRASEQRQLARMALTPQIPPIREPHVWHDIEVRITRIGPRKLDSDNLARACKAVRDGIADAVGLDDGDPRFDWDYDQRTKGRSYGVIIEFHAEGVWFGEAVR